MKYYKSITTNSTSHYSKHSKDILKGSEQVTFEITGYFVKELTHIVDRYRQLPEYFYCK